MLVHFLTHPEVEIDPEVPVTEWILSAVGRQRARAVAEHLPQVRAVRSSPELKAEQTAQLIGDGLGLAVALSIGLSEIDRSATGYLPEPDFWANYHDFIALPTQSARGWETAEAAQRRIVRTVHESVMEAAADTAANGGDLVLVSHGGVGALLMCDLNQTPIQRLQDQPGQGSHFSFDADSWQLRTPWRAFEQLG